MNNKFLEQAKEEAQHKKNTPKVAKIPKVVKERKKNGYFNNCVNTSE